MDAAVMERSFDDFDHFVGQSIDARRKTHVHELRLGVHLESSEDSAVDLELQYELHAFVSGVFLQRCEHIALLRLVQVLSRDNSDLLLIVEQLVQFKIFLRNVIDVHESLTVAADLDEFVRHVVEVSDRAERIVEGIYFPVADSRVSGEELEIFAVFIERDKVSHVLVNFEKRVLQRGGGEEHGGEPALDCIFVDGGLVVVCGVDSLDVD